MAKKRKKKKNIIRRILDSLKKSNISKTNPGIRKVYIGIRLRFLGFLCVVVFIIITILTVTMYINQRELLREEKNQKAMALTGILTGPAEFYLDRDIETSKEDMKLKYETIKKEAGNFKKYNEDINKIVLTDSKGNVKFSTSKLDWKNKKVLPYIDECLKKKEEKLTAYDFSVDKKIKKTEEVEKIKYRAVTYPLILHSGNVVNLLNDYNKYYNQFQKANNARKKQIYVYLYQKYKDTLGEEFNPNPKVDKDGKKAESLNEKKDDRKKVTVVNDVDFMFLDLFNNIMKHRMKRIAKSERWLWNSKWLYIEKRKKLDAYENDQAGQAKEIHDLITERIDKLAKKVEEIRLLGALAIVFDINKINQEINKNIFDVVKLAGIMMGVSVFLFLIVLQLMIQNLKKLEKWAIKVSGGNLDSKIKIESNDEIGRLGDIANFMIDEIKVKYHLEKFVSKSTKSMIKQKESTNEVPDLGITSRKDIAFIFSDVRGFTSFSEQNKPEIVVKVLNFYLNIQSKIVKGERGDIDDYVGDEIMAHFTGDKKADRAVRSAVKMMKTVKKENIKRKEKGLPVFEVGIGVHGGEVVTGNIGSDFRMDFACIGDAVNLSSRLCSNAKAGEILVSEELFSQVTHKYKVDEKIEIEVKGKAKKIPIVKIIV